MNLKAVIPLALAVVLGLVAAVLVRNAMAHRDVAAAPSNLVTVVAAKQDVDPGRPLTADDLVVSKVPADAAPGQVFSDPNQLINRVPTTPLVKGQTILETLLAPVGSAAGLQALVPPGMRAFTIDVNDSSSVGGMLTPGCRVDVLTLVHDSKTGDQVLARTVLQNIKVTAVGRIVNNAPPAPGQPPAPPANNVTLLLTPRQAQIMELASMMSRPWLVLRGNRDSGSDPVDPTSVSELRGDEAAPATQPAVAVAAPATQPSVAQATPAPEPTTIKQVVQVLHGETEADVTFVTPAPAPAPITATNDIQEATHAQ